MNDENLITFDTLSESERREMGRKGGKASVEARRKRKTLKEELLLLLSEGDTQNKVSVALIAEALNGNVRAFETLRDTIGEKPVEKVEVGKIDKEQSLKELRELFDDDE